MTNLGIVGVFRTFIVGKQFSFSSLKTKEELIVVDVLKFFGFFFAFQYNLHPST